MKASPGLPWVSSLWPSVSSSSTPPAHIDWGRQERLSTEDFQSPQMGPDCALGRRQNWWSGKLARSKRPLSMLLAPFQLSPPWPPVGLYPPSGAWRRRRHTWPGVHRLPAQSMPSSCQNVNLSLATFGMRIEPTCKALELRRMFRRLKISGIFCSQKSLEWNN